MGQIDYHVSQDPLELDDLYGIDIEGPLPKRETDSIEPVAVPPILTSVEMRHLLETLNANSDWLCLGLKVIRDCNWTQTQNHLVRKRAINHLAKLAK